jgi:hypothetical protein
MPEVPSIIEFDVTRAMRYNPIRKLEIIRIVEKPAHEETVIENGLLGPKAFVGTYVEVLDPETNDVRYGYDYDHFMKTHTPWEGVENGWYDSAPMDAYQTDTDGELFTGRGNETQHVYVSDWIYRDRDGAVGRIGAQYFPQFYDLDSARPIPQEPT